jgi:hypothetical protein
MKAKIKLLNEKEYDKYVKGYFGSFKSYIHFRSQFSNHHIFDVQKHPSIRRINIFYDIESNILFHRKELIFLFDIKIKSLLDIL